MGKDANIGIFRVGEALIGHTTSSDAMESRDLVSPAFKGLLLQEIIEAYDIPLRSKTELIREVMFSEEFSYYHKTKIAADGFYLLDTLLADKARTTSTDSIYGAESLPVHKVKFTADGGMIDEEVYAMKGAFIRDVLDAQDGLVRDMTTFVRDEAAAMDFVKMTRIVLMLDVARAADRFLAGKAITMVDEANLDDIHLLAKEAIVQEVMYHLETQVMGKLNLAQDGMGHTDKSLADVNTTVREYVGLWEVPLVDKVLQVAEQTLGTDNTLTFKTMFEIDALAGIDANVFFKLKMTAEEMDMVDGFEIPFRTIVVAESGAGDVEIRRGAPFAIVQDEMEGADTPKVDKWLDVGDALIALELPIGARALDLVKTSFRDVPIIVPFLLHLPLNAPLYATEAVEAHHSTSDKLDASWPAPDTIAAKYIIDEV